MSVIAVFLSVMITGLGCGIGCGSLSTPLLLGRMLGEVRTKKECMMASGIFALGKIAMYMVLGLLSAIFGSMVLHQVQTFHPNITQNIFRFVNMLFGVLIILSAFRKDKCSSCQQCKNNAFILIRLKDPSYFIIGLFYAMIPCSPLIIALTYAAGMRPLLAVLLMACFGIVNSLFSVIIYAPIIGTIIGKMQDEIPNHYKWIQVFSGIMLIGMSAFIEFK